VQQPGFHERLEATSTALASGLQAAADAAGVPFSTVHVGGMFGFFLRGAPPRDLAEAQQADVARFGQLFRALLAQGLYFAPSAFEAGFVTAAHDAAVIGETIERAGKAFAAV
ncbi:MAG: aspartate aminotransferase family protein, partial [Porticoccaceae bacterium]